MGNKQEDVEKEEYKEDQQEDGEKEQGKELTIEGGEEEVQHISPTPSLVSTKRSLSLDTTSLDIIYMEEEITNDEQYHTSETEETMESEEEAEVEAEKHDKEQRKEEDRQQDNKQEDVEKEECKEDLQEEEEKQQGKVLTIEGGEVEVQHTEPKE